MKKNNFSSCRGVPCKHNLLQSKKLMLVFMFLFSFVIYGQKINFKGKVYDANGLPLFGVSVVIKGTNNGVNTGVDGEFEISAQINQTLVFSFIGFENKEFLLRRATTISINMVSKQEKLNDVVVIGYGRSQKKESVLGAISQVSGKALTMVKMGSSLENNLQGKLPGLTVIMTDPTPGEEALGGYYAASPIKMSIRGNSSMGSNTPLFIVDGVERPFSNINANDVESVSILKDASATAVYGVKGANGVIIVKTKRGRSGGIEVNFSSSLSLKEAAILPKYMNSYETMKLRNEAWANDGLWDLRVSDEVLQHYKDQDLPYLYPNFDWMKYYFKTAIDQTYDVSIRGGNDFVKYYSSIGYLNEGDIWATGNDFPYSYDKQNAHYGSTRYNFINNLDFAITKSSNLSINLGGNVKAWGKPIDTFTQEQWFESVTTMPYYPADALTQYPDITIPYDQNGGVRPFIKPASGEVRRNWIGGQGFSRFKANQLNVDLKFDQKLDFITKGLSSTLLYSYNTNIIYQKDYNLYQYFGYYLDPITKKWTRYDNGGGENLDTPQPVLQVNNSENVFQGSRTHYYEFRTTYDNSFGKHNVNAMGIFSRRQSIYSLAEFPHYEENWVGRSTYNYDNRYFLEGSFAYTGSEKFAPGNRFGFFPSGAAGWVLSNEKFFESLKNTVNLLKFRYSYGIVGSDAGIDRWLYNSTYRQDGGVNFGFPQQWYPYIKEGNLPVLDATWEKAYKQNLGIELGFLDNLFTFTLDLFNEKRVDILQVRQQIPSWGGVSNVVRNVGSSKSHGLEATFGINKYFDNGAFITFLGNLTAQDNRMVYYDESENLPFNLKVEGKPVDIARRLGSYTPATGLVDQGFYQNFDELFLYPRAGGVSPIVGDLKFLDFNGDGAVDDQDRVAAKDPSIPIMTWNANIGGGYKNFSFDMNFYGISDVEVPTRQGGMFFLYPFSQNKDNAYTAHANHWTPTNTNPEFPAVHAEATKQYNYQISNYSMIPGKYIRLRSASLRYDIKSPALLKAARINNLQVGLIGTNLWTWKKNKWGGDPEGANYGVDFGAYPQMKRFTFEVRASF